MSNRIVYDPLLVRYLSEELDGALRGRACAAAPFFAPDLGVMLPLQGGRALRVDLHPTRGWVRIVDHPDHPGALDSHCAGVESPADERALVIRLAPPDRFGAAGRRLVIELHTNQWNAVLVSEEDERMLAVLRPRSAGGRSVRAGEKYAPPAGEVRYGAEEVDEAEAWETWRARLEPEEPGARRAAVLRGFAYTGTPNVGAIVGDAASSTEADALRGAFRRWWWLRSLPPARPAILRLESGPLPYPLPLPGLPTEAIPTLLAGMSLLAERTGEPEAPGRPAADAALIAAAARRADALERRVARLQEELSAAGEAARLRGFGDLLLARLRELPRGADRVELEGWDGEMEVIEMDPSLSPAENAARLYDEARKRERAEARLPDLIRGAQEEAERWRAVANAPPGSPVPEWARQALERSGSRETADGGAGAESRPYRVYRTSGGLEVRVGRSARANDRLTFGHSSPNDVWLHAQSVPGSHVVLRWVSPDSAPPARDLQEAAVLAARYSRARTSTVVAVDWTRRKHVRKPRGAPPGSVVIQRAKTLFVEPDSAVEERMRED